MQFNIIALALATMATVASELPRTVTVYACSTSLTSAAGVASPTASVASTGASTGIVTAPTATGSPITYATGAASINGASAIGMIVAGGISSVPISSSLAPLSSAMVF